MLEVLKNQRLAVNYYLLETRFEEAKTIQPGQFFHLKIGKDDSYDPLLRRPLSVHQVKPGKGRISFLYRIIGRGTKILSNYQPGDMLDALGPLGSGFRTDFRNKQILIIGGGMGIVPIYYLVNSLNSCNQVTLLIGANNGQELKCFLDFPVNAATILDVASIDGSVGLKGTVIDLWEKKYLASLNPDFLFACGPKAMLQKAQEIAGRRNIPGQVSLEERMGCGIGVCLACVCKTKDGNQRICKEGPVFSLPEVIFNDRD